MRPLLYLIAFVPLISGAVTAVLGLRESRAEGELRRGGQRAVGAVVAMKSTAPDGVPGHFPEVRFTTENGKSVQGLSQNPIPRPYTKNTPIEVVYDPTAPTRFHAGPSRARVYWVAAGLFTLVGTLTLIFLLIAGGSPW